LRQERSTFWIIFDFFWWISSKCDNFKWNLIRIFFISAKIKLRIFSNWRHKLNHADVFLKCSPLVSSVSKDVLFVFTLLILLNPFCPLLAYASFFWVYFAILLHLCGIAVKYKNWTNLENKGFKIKGSCYPLWYTLPLGVWPRVTLGYPWLQNFRFFNFKFF